MSNEVETVVNAAANSDMMWAYIAVGVCALAITVVAWGLTKLWTTLIETVGRNPQAKKDVSSFGLIGMGSIEAVALYIFVLAILLILKN